VSHSLTYKYKLLNSEQFLCEAKHCGSKGTGCEHQTVLGWRLLCSFNLQKHSAKYNFHKI